MKPIKNKREVFAKCLKSSPDVAVFDVRFHDGYQKTFTITRSECVASRMSDRDLLENYIIDYYVDTEGAEPHILLFFC